MFKSLWLAKVRKENDLNCTISELPPSAAAVESGGNSFSFRHDVDVGASNRLLFRLKQTMVGVISNVYLTSYIKLYLHKICGVVSSLHWTLSCLVTLASYLLIGLCWAPTVILYTIFFQSSLSCCDQRGPSQKLTLMTNLGVERRSKNSKKVLHIKEKAKESKPVFVLWWSKSHV